MPYKAFVKVPEERVPEFQTSQFSGFDELGHGAYLIDREQVAKGKIRWGGYTFNALRKMIEKISGTVRVIYQPDRARDVAVCVGSGYYPTIENFVNESRRLGTCRRISHLPDDVIPGKSRVWLIHDNGYKIKEGEDKRKLSGIGTVFGFFVVSRVEAILADGEEKKELNRLVPIKYLRMMDIVKEPRRGCGLRRPGAYYLVGDPDFEKYFQLAKTYTDKFDVAGDIVLLKERVRYPGKRFRGVKYADQIKELRKLLIIEKLYENASKEMYQKA